jgi:2'-5' RNA ligase
MQCGPQKPDRINSFSLVSYIPGGLGDSISRIRRELVAGCVAQSHVTVLPPRPLFVAQEVAEEELRERVAAFAPVRVAIPRLRTFEQTGVVFADIGEGRGELIEMHNLLNKNSFHFDEPFAYHPHITLAQGIPPEQLARVFSQAQDLWNRDVHERSFLIETLTFVQNTVENCWIDLADCELRAVPA